jgi:hypothetical protein
MAHCIMKCVSKIDERLAALYEIGLKKSSTVTVEELQKGQFYAGQGH